MPTTGSTTTTLTIRIPRQSTSNTDSGNASQSTTGILNQRPYTRAKAFLKHVLQNEINNLDKYSDHLLLWDLLQKYQCRDALVKAFADQLVAYRSDQWPFKMGRNPQVDPYSWWKWLAHDNNTDVLAVSSQILLYLASSYNKCDSMHLDCCFKDFAVLPNSMADERTGSNMTWFNSALRSNQSVDTLVNLVQVGQWYKIHEPRVSSTSLQLRC